MFPASDWWRSSVALLFLSAASTASAQDFIEEIVISADFRERAARDVAASVAVIDETRIREAAVQHFEELIVAVPNLNWSGDGNRARYLQIRGVGELEQYEGAPNPSVGFLIDDIDFSGIGSIATLFDMQTVEVLRGPQGTRYGANALAGLVYARSAEPGATRSARLRLSAGGDDLVAGGFALGGPLTEDGRLRGRVSLHRHDSDGFRRNRFLGRDDSNGRRETTARAKLDWDTHGDWSFRLAALYADLDNGYDAFALDNSLEVLSDRPGRDAQRSVGLSLRSTRDAGGATTFTAITSLADSDIDFSFDADWGNPDSWAPFVYDYTSATHRERRTLSQEFRLASDTGGDRHWLIGLYGLALDESFQADNQGVYEDLVVFDFTDALDERLDSDFEAVNLAAFGQAGFSVFGAGELTLGLRVEHRSADYADSDGLDLGPDETMIGGEIAYSRSFSDAVNAYLSVSRGYKAGGFNLGRVPPGRREFGTEFLWSVEAGVKSASGDGRLSVNATAFYNRRDDQQVRVSEQLNPNDPASFVFFTDNAARGESFGLEADVRWLPTDSLELYAGAGLLDAYFDSFGGDGAALDGRDQAHAPGYTLAMGAVYRHPRGYYARIDASASDAFYFDVSHDRRSEAFELVNLRLGYETASWSAQLWARNLFDETYAVRGFFFGNEPPDFPAALYIRQGDPRQVGVTFELFFEE